jgi:ATP-dependent Clp protease adaptor protein ClpS
MSTATDTAQKIKISPKLDLIPPTDFKVIYVNDEVTTMEFVVESLKAIFNYSEDRAKDLCIKIHEEGSAVVAVFPYEIAEQKGVEATLLARKHGFPLQVKLEPT